MLLFTGVPDDDTSCKVQFKFLVILLRVCYQINLQPLQYLCELLIITNFLEANPGITLFIYGNDT